MFGYIVPLVLIGVFILFVLVMPRRESEADRISEEDVEGLEKVDIILVDKKEYKYRSEGIVVLSKKMPLINKFKVEVIFYNDIQNAIMKDFSYVDEDIYVQGNRVPIMLRKNGSVYILDKIIQDNKDEKDSTDSSSDVADIDNSGLQ